jgi:hypothetical protein
MKKRFVSPEGLVLYIETGAAEAAIGTGQLGGELEVENYNFKTPEECRAEIEKLIAQKTGPAWRVVFNPGEPTENEKRLRAEIEAGLNQGESERIKSAIRETLASDTGIGEYFREYGIGVGMFIAEKLQDQDLDDEMRFHLPAAAQDIQSQTLAFNMACLYAEQGDKETMMPFVRRALELGQTTAQFIDGSFDAFFQDEDFRAAIMVDENVDQEFYHLKADQKFEIKMDEIHEYPYLPLNGFCVKGKFIPPLLHFNISTENKPIPHFLYVGNVRSMLVSDELHQVINQVGLKVQTFPVILRDEKNVEHSYHLLNVTEVHNVLDNDVCRQSARFPYDFVQYDTVVIHDLKLKPGYRLFLPSKAEYYLFASGAAWEKLRPFLPQRNLGFSAVKLEVSQHKPMQHQ